MIVARYCRVNWNRLRRLPTVKVIQRTAILVATAIRLRRCQPRTSLTYAQASPIGANSTVAPQHRHRHSQVTSESDSDSTSIRPDEYVCCQGKRVWQIHAVHDAKGKRFTVRQAVSSFVYFLIILTSPIIML